LNPIKIRDIALTNLSDHLAETGSILYSSYKTLKPGALYILGFNPGGEGGDTLKENIDSMLTRESNSYLDEEWENNNGSWEKGEAPLQKRLIWLTKELGYNLREICASNLIFIKSQNQKSIDYNIAMKCWPIHEEILKLVKPKVILTFGNSNTSPYHFLHSKYKGEEFSEQSGHGNWLIKSFETRINEQKTVVIGLPHLSRYSPVNKDHVIRFIKNKI